MKKLLLFCCVLLMAGSAGAQCTVSLSATQNPTGNNLLNVSFTNSSTYGFPFSGQKKSFNINFGDMTGLSNYQGTTVPDHVYPNPGTYTIGFRIRSYDSASGITVCTDSATITVTVAYPPCGATVSVTGTGATKTFTATNPAGTSGISYSWNFGDGNTGSGSPVSHTYTATGNYTVTLTASSGSCTYTNNSTSVFVYIPPPPLNCSTLKAAFSANVSANIATFTNTSNVATGAYQTIANWDFGDGNTTTGYNIPPHAYTTPGVYTVKLVMRWKDSLNTTSCKDSVTKIISITSAPPPANLISGNIVYDTTYLGINYFKVYLIKYDSATQWLSAVDSVTTGNTASPYYAFGNKPAGLYRTEAVAQNGASLGTGFVPTYHDSSVYWNTAAVINHNGGSTLNKRIYMHHGSTASGSGFIGGNVAYGANKGAGSGVANLIIFLRDANMQVVQSTLTDASGNYAFSNIPLGPYSIWPEQMNYTTMPRTPLVVNGSNPSLTDIDFNVDDVKRTIAPRNPLGIARPAISSDFLTVSPVPASDRVTITWNGVNDAGMQFTITNLTGQVVISTPVLQGKAGTTELSLSGLSHGVYFIHGTGSLASKVARLVIQ